jgi:hypothetical protein
MDARASLELSRAMENVEKVFPEPMAESSARGSFALHCVVMPMVGELGVS